MQTWPPPETPLFLVDHRGVSPAIFHRVAHGIATISMKYGMRSRDPETGALVRGYSIGTKEVPFDHLFATEETARAAFDGRRAAKRAA